MAQENLEFKSYRAFFWPIHRHEIKKFVPMLILFFLVFFNYNLLKIAKDPLIVTAPKGGAETIPFLKLWAILPSAILFTFLFTKLSNKFNREKIFYVIISIFICFFTFFIFVLYPLREHLFLNSFCDFLQNILPNGFKGLISVLRYWVYSLFYIFSETWSTMMCSLLVWGFANDVTKVNESKRFYALFGIGVNSSGIFAGYLIATITGYFQTKTTGINPVVKFLGAQTSFDEVIYLIIFLSIIVSFIMIIIYKYLHVKFFPERASFANACPITKKPKKKMSLKENVSYIFKSKYLLYVTIIVLAYNLIINLTEVLWKSQLRELFPQSCDYTSYMSKITLFTGIIATTTSYFFSGSFIRKFGWRAAALLTPFIILTTSLGFFYFLFMRNFINTEYTFIGMSALALCVFFGSMQNILSRAAKYTVFDDTKEMAFIPLSSENKIKGKSAIDGIGSRLGKSGSSLLQQILLMIFGSPIACSPAIAIIIFLIIPFWLKAIKQVNKEFVVHEEKPLVLSDTTT